MMIITIVSNSSYRIHNQIKHRIIKWLTGNFPKLSHLPLIILNFQLCELLSLFIFNVKVTFLLVIECLIMFNGLFKDCVLP